MRRKALWRLVAAVMGAVLLVPSAAQPAKANDPNWDSYVDLGVDLLVSFLDKGRDGLDPLELLQLTQELKAALGGVKVDLLAHIDALALAEIRGGVKYTVDNAKFLDLPGTRAQYVNQVAREAADAHAKLTVFAGDAARDTVGKAIITEYQALLIAEGRTGLPPSYNEYKEALQHVIDNVKPTCRDSIDNPTGQSTYSCSFDGETFTGVERGGPTGQMEHRYDGSDVWIPGEMDRDLVANVVMEETAQDLAVRALAALILSGH